MLRSWMGVGGGVVGCPGGGVSGGSGGIWLACLSVRFVQVIASHESPNIFAVGLGAYVTVDHLAVWARETCKMFGLLQFCYDWKKRSFYVILSQWYLTPQNNDSYIILLNLLNLLQGTFVLVLFCNVSQSFCAQSVDNWLNCHSVSNYFIRILGECLTNDLYLNLRLAAVDIDIEISFQAPPSTHPQKQKQKPHKTWGQE